MYRAGWGGERATIGARIPAHSSVPPRTGIAWSTLCLASLRPLPAMSQIDLRARSTSEIVDAAFALYRRDAMQYTVIGAIAYSPVLILSVLTTGARAPTTLSDVWGAMPVLLVSFLVYAVVSAVIVRMGADVYLGERPDVARTLRDVLPRIPALLVSSVLNGFLLLIGLVFLIVPVFYMLAILFAVVPAVVLEKNGPFGALRRSVRLSKDRKGHILATLLLSYGLYFVLSLGISWMATQTGSTILVQVVSSLYNIFAYPVINLVVMVLYYDIRIRAEGFDLEHMAQAIGNAGPARPAGGALA